MSSENDKIYWFITSASKDMIAEYDVATEAIDGILVDTGSVLNFNEAIVSLDLLFFQFDFPIGVIILTVFCLGILTTIILEVLYFSSRNKRSD